jgi:xylan 1,4-beta-xylosidase
LRQSRSKQIYGHSKSNEGIFAATIRYHEGHFYVVTTNFAEFRTFILKGTLVGDQIKWEDSRVEVDVPGIDPDLFFEDGRTYLQFTGYIDDKGTKAIRQVEINLSTGEILDGPKILTYGTGGRDVEGPHILKKDGNYYLLVAEGGTGQGHMITIFKGPSVWGPFEDEPGVNPLFTNRDRAEMSLQNVGHSDLFTDARGNWWLTCLATRPAAVGFSQITNIGRRAYSTPLPGMVRGQRFTTGVQKKRLTCQTTLSTPNCCQPTKKVATLKITLKRA